MLHPFSISTTINSFHCFLKGQDVFMSCPLTTWEFLLRPECSFFNEQDQTLKFDPKKLGETPLNFDYPSNQHKIQLFINDSISLINRLQASQIDCIRSQIAKGQIFFINCIP